VKEYQGKNKEKKPEGPSFGEKGVGEREEET